MDYRTRQHLRTRWLVLVPSAELVDDLLARWSEPHRRYHTLDHLAAVLEHLDWLGPAPPAVSLAGWYHDAVYRPEATDNERASADLARLALSSAGLCDDVVSEVGRLILTTASHMPDPRDAPAALLNDADLAVLGSDPDGYAAYRMAVREEYGHLDDAAWRAGRASVLRALVDRPRLFLTDPGRARWEAAARTNLAAELASL